MLPLCLAISRAPLYFSAYTKQDFVSRQKNRLVIIAIQALYGWGLSIYNPSFTEYLEWAIMPSFQLGAHYENTSPQIELYYESSHEAEKIAELLPNILKNIQTSPFYSLNKKLKLCQKNTFNNIFDIEEYRGQGILGHYNPVKKISYVYLSNENKDISEEDYIGAITHELTHQMLHQSYGIWDIGLHQTIPLWKDEGYAEFIGQKHRYLSRREILDSIAQSKDIRELLENSSWLFEKKLVDPYDHYIAALIQTRYALEHLQISPQAFFDKAYKPASIENIRSWLSMES